MVDLPTPPLPEATAMMFSAVRPEVFVDFAGVDFLAHVDFGAFNAGDKFQGIGDDLFQAAGDALKGMAIRPSG